MSEYRRGKTYPKKESQEILNKTIKKVSNMTGMSEWSILRKSRNRKIVNSRRMVVYILRSKYDMGWSNISRLINFNHATIIHNYNYVVNNHEYDPEIRQVKEMVDCVTKEDEDMIKKTYSEILNDKYSSLDDKLDILVNLLRDEEGDISQYDKLRMESYTARKRSQEASQDVEKINLYDVYNWKDS